MYAAKEHLSAGGEQSAVQRIKSAYLPFSAESELKPEIWFLNRNTNKHISMSSPLIHDIKKMHEKEVHSGWVTRFILMMGRYN